MGILKGKNLERKMKRTILFLAILLAAVALATSLAIVLSIHAQKNGESSFLSSLFKGTSVSAALTSHATPTPYSPKVSSLAAAQIALSFAGDGISIASTPTLVTYNDKYAYEVDLLDGSKIYIDSSTGALLFNSLTNGATAAISSIQAANIAAKFFGGGEVYGVNRIIYKNTIGYAVAFWNGDAAFVDMRGNVLYNERSGSGVTPAQPTINVDPNSGDHE
jgi:hypothetical protein